MMTFNSKNKIGMRDELFNAYLREGKNKVMSRQEEEEAFMRLARGDESARNEIIEANRLFVVKMARSYATQDNLMDLINSGNLGLYYATLDFDYTKGNKFISYAVWYIKREINNYLINKNVIVRKSNSAKTYGKITKIKESLFQKLMRVPTEDEVKEEYERVYNTEIKDKSDLYDVSQVSLSSCVDGDDELEFVDSALFNEKTYSENECVENENQEYNANLLDALFKGISEREQLVLKMSFGIGYYKEYTIEEIADELNLTKERVRQIKSESLVKMRKYSKTAHVG